jgi:hypothetical protein
MKSAIDRQIHKALSKQPGQRHEYTRAELDQLNLQFVPIVEAAVREVFDGH